jgi:ribosomal-protein-alanine N-acetyltransferase
MKLRRETQRLIIRPLTLSDYYQWKSAHLCLQPAQNEWDTGYLPEHQLSLAQFKKELKQQVIDRQRDHTYQLAVFLKSDGSLIGRVALMDVSRAIFQNAYLGYSIFNIYWNQGFGKEAVKAGIEIAFEDLKLHRVEAGIQPKNKASIALAQSLKMKNEGKSTKRLFVKDRWVDILIFSKINSKFKF